MSDWSELKRLAEAALPDEDSPYLPCQVAFMIAAAPAAVLGLISEVERYRQYGCDTCDGSGRLHRIDGEYYGACTSCGAHDLEQAKRGRDQLKAENEALRAVANELRRFASCNDVHHDRADQHEYDEPCKVLARIDAVLGQGEKSGG